MKYLKKFEKFDLGRFNKDEIDKKEFDIIEVEDIIVDGEDEEEDDKEIEKKVWGDEIIERKL